MDLSILVPSYNPGRFGADALSSVLPQLAKDDELLIQDNCSTDGWLVRAAAFEDPRIRVVSERDDGQADALNRALARAENEVIGWLNADDIYLAHSISRVKSVFDQDPTAQVVYGGHRLITADGAVLREDTGSDVTLSKLMLLGNIPFSGSLFIRTEFLRSMGGFAAGLDYCMDYELCLRLWNHDQLVAKRLEAPVGALRLHGESKTGRLPWRFVWEARRVRQHQPVSFGMRIASEGATVLHALAVASTPLRHSNWYSRLKNRTVA